MRERSWKSPWGKNSNHVIWLEPNKAAYNVNEDVEIKVFWGSVRNPEVGEYEDWLAYLLDPEGARLELPIRREMLRFSGGKPFFFLAFKPRKSGPYTIMLENNYGVLNKLKDGDWTYGPKRYHRNVEESIYFYQYAKTIVPVGESTQGSTRVGNELEIITTKTGFYVNDIMELTLLCRGSPLPRAQIKAVYGIYPHIKEETAETDMNGKAGFHIKEKGVWLFVAEHKIMEGVDGEYDYKWLTATLSLPVRGIKNAKHD